MVFGEGVNREMCFLWAYHFPGMGLEIGLDGYRVRSFVERSRHAGSRPQENLLGRLSLARSSSAPPLT